MYAVIRRYKGATALFEELAKREQDVKNEVLTVPGFISYYPGWLVEARVAVLIRHRLRTLTTPSLLRNRVQCAALCCVQAGL
jgi:hypothetical protein